MLIFIITTNLENKLSSKGDDLILRPTTPGQGVLDHSICIFVYSGGRDWPAAVYVSLFQRQAHSSPTNQLLAILTLATSWEKDEHDDSENTTLKTVR